MHPHPTRGPLGDAPIPWRDAWHGALYGPQGFYRAQAGPAGHFTTATHGHPGRVLATALWAWADRLEVDGIVDVGAGRGELLAHLRDLEPRRPLAGVDVVRRPDTLAAGIGWVRSPGGAALPDELAPANALVVAHEWLDVVPCTVAAAADDGTLCEVLVEPGTGVESLGERLAGPDLQWCERFWPQEGGLLTSGAHRVEVGRQRDAAWQDLLDRMSGGAALAVDYGHVAGSRPDGGTLTAYRDGVQVTPVPDGSCDVTAHVAVDSLRHDELLSQREALRRVGISGALPDHQLATSDPAGYLAGLGRASAAATLLSPGGFGDFWWVLALT